MGDPTFAGWAALLLRIGGGIVFLAHGVIKLLREGAGGEIGMARLTESITKMGFPLPRAWAYAVAVVQTGGGLLLLLGLFTSWAALAQAVIMVVATYWSQRSKGFLQGADFPLAMLGIMLALALLGDGRLSLGRWLGW